MKKIISVLFCGIIIYLAITANVAAQEVSKGVSFAATKDNAALPSGGNETISAGKSESSAKESLKEAKAKLKALKANNRAAESFNKMFRDAPGAKWVVEEKAIVASFNRNDVKTSVIYSKNGSWIHNLTYYPANKTPEHIRSIVESNYPNADITLAVEVQEGGLEFFIVQLEDKRTYKKIGVYNGETNLIEEYNKSK
jgi:hypothetical protein